MKKLIFTLIFILALLLPLEIASRAYWAIKNQVSFFNILTLPYTLYSLSIDIQEKVGLIHFVPTDIPNEDWVQYGNDIKSAVSFEQNLEDILQLAKKRQHPVLMASLAFHVPRDYSYFKFKTKQLDYGNHAFYIEVWGKAEHVIRGIITHNDVMNKLGNNHPEITFLDEYPRMPQNAQYFNDLCHLTALGNEKLLSDFAQAIMTKN